MENDEKQKISKEIINFPKANFRLKFHEGYWLWDWEFNSDDKLELYRNFETRRDDVWIATYPKSGTTWMQEIVYLIMNDCDVDKAKLCPLEDRSPFLEIVWPNHKTVADLESPRIISTHFPLSLLPNIHKKVKLIYVVRNPKDVAVSYYHFINMIKMLENTGDFRTFAEMFMNGMVTYGPWWQHIAEYLKVKEEIFFVHYEDLIISPKENIEKLAKFLGKNLTDFQIDIIVKASSFDSMKNNPMANRKVNTAYREDGNFIRKGKIGDWLNYFDLELSIKFDEVIEKHLLDKEITFNYGVSKEEAIQFLQSKQNK